MLFDRRQPPASVAGEGSEDPVRRYDYQRLCLRSPGLREQRHRLNRSNTALFAESTGRAQALHVPFTSKRTRNLRI